MITGKLSIVNSRSKFYILFPDTDTLGINLQDSHGFLCHSEPKAKNLGHENAQKTHKTDPKSRATSHERRIAGARIFREKE